MLSKYYLEKLQQFPHRGLGTKEEKAAAKMIYDEYSRLGYTPKYYYFKSLWNGLSIGYLMNALYFLLSGIFYLFDLNIVSAIFLIWGIISMFFLTYKDNSIYKHVFPVKSQSVYAEKLKKDGKLNIVLVGHYDTAKRMIFLKYMNSIFDILVKKQLKDGKKVIGAQLPSFFASPTIFFNLMTVLQSIILFLVLFDIHFTAIVIILCIVWIIGIFVAALQPIFSSYVPGANDNGSGVSIVLALAEKFSKTELKNSSLYFLNDSSEENIVKSVVGWADSVKFDKSKTLFINLDGLAAGQLSITEREVDDIGFKITYDKKGYDFVDKFWKENKYYYKNIKVLLAPVSTDANSLIKAGYRVLVTMGSMTKTGSFNHYHQLTDTIKVIDWKSMELCEKFVTELIEKIDESWENLTL